MLERIEQQLLYLEKLVDRMTKLEFDGDDVLFLATAETLRDMRELQGILTALLEFKSGESLFGP